MKRNKKVSSLATIYNQIKIIHSSWKHKNYIFIAERKGASLFQTIFIWDQVIKLKLYIHKIYKGSHFLKWDTSNTFHWLLISLYSSITLYKQISVILKKLLHWVFKYNDFKWFQFTLVYDKINVILIDWQMSTSSNKRNYIWHEDIIKSITQTFKAWFEMSNSTYED